jgi:hypothetical protein
MDPFWVVVGIVAVLALIGYIIELTRQDGGSSFYIDPGAKPGMQEGTNRPDRRGGHRSPPDLNPLRRNAIDQPRTDGGQPVREAHECSSSRASQTDWQRVG